MGEGNSISEGLEAGRHVMNGSGKLPVSMAAALEDKWSGAAPGNKAATHLGVSRLVKCGKFQLRGAVSIKGASLVAQRVKNPPANTGDPGLMPGSGRSLEKEMATHSGTPAWKIPWMEKPGKLQSIVSQRVGHD